jgi:hypothetical protein
MFDWVRTFGSSSYSRKKSSREKSRTSTTPRKPPGRFSCTCWYSYFHSTRFSGALFTKRARRSPVFTFSDGT